MQRDRKNVLVIFSDQQHKYALGKVNPEFITPNLDALCDEGVLFENGYSNNPVCGPYRGCLITGCYTSHCGVVNNNDPLPNSLVPLGTMMRDSGYATGFVGKWHLGGNGAGPIPFELRGGFEHFMGYQCYNGFDPRPPYNNEVVFFDEKDVAHQYQVHRTDMTAKLAIDQLRVLSDSGKPFFQLVGFQAPHYPEQPSDEFASLYEGKIFEKTPDYQEVDPYIPTYSPYSPRPFEMCPDYQRYGNNMDKFMCLYAGLVSQVDRGVGWIIDELKRLGIYEDTVIIYTSDHGDMQGSHGAKGKCLPHEKSCGVPFIARYPGGVKGERVKIPVSGVDIFATAGEIAGENGLICDGSSLLSVIRDNEEPKRKYVVAEYSAGPQSSFKWFMIRDQRYKLVINYEDKKPMWLFDLDKDPYELYNLIDDSEQMGNIAQLLDILRYEMERLPQIGNVNI